ncbi:MULTISPECIES: Rrf2 family transcriptional regulator [unclassified Granulicatella]|uniref:RrF2 family transcriptional regulator n=1 Tax=unclassified Granulicatella TaxID=2630493 RepID=UPI0010742B60|nr:MULTISPECIES: Rrf2 family transcriptional regulator [unclassified Granulicatella]MBF0780632.1 Rrf2 family transcriptional regulator [Granulicatella sp. 19428wC4_WM01]TFU94590.1 Rrf2 family transcriptional regulator [Granulicatella sp. WM01]
MDTKFSVAIHILIMISESTHQLTSQDIASSVQTNASYIRKIISLLKKANLLVRYTGSFEYALGKSKKEMTLFDIYKAVHTDTLLYTHQHANKQCPVGNCIYDVLHPIMFNAEKALEQYLSSKTLHDVIEDIMNMSNT